MQSTVRNSYSYSVFQVSPTQTRNTLSWHSGRGGASKHPNNYSGGHMTSRWLSLQANRSALRVDKNNSSPRQNAYDMFSSSLLSAKGTFSVNWLSFYFIWFITQGCLHSWEMALGRPALSVTVCSVWCIWCKWFVQSKEEMETIHRFSSDSAVDSSGDTKPLL